MIGHRILVYGPSGSGKTTLAQRIGAARGLPVVELDAMFHRPNWEPTPEAEFVESVLARLDGYADGWVCDGNYGAVRRHILRAADTVVWLKLPFPTVYWRLFRRTVTRAWTKEPLWGTNYESWRASFMSRDSILLWGLTHWRAHFRGVGRDLREIEHQANVVELRSDREVEDLVASVERQPAQ